MLFVQYFTPASSKPAPLASSLPQTQPPDTLGPPAYHTISDSDEEEEVKEEVVTLKERTDKQQKEQKEQKDPSLLPKLEAAMKVKTVPARSELLHMLDCRQKPNNELVKLEEKLERVKREMTEQPGNREARPGSELSNSDSTSLQHTENSDLPSNANPPPSKMVDERVARNQKVVSAEVVERKPAARKASRVEQGEKKAIADTLVPLLLPFLKSGAISDKPAFKVN